jgi:YfiH family protein
VHGKQVALASADSVLPADADAIVCSLPGQAIAVATADCVPVLACSEDGRCVAAIHAGWRGLALGVVAEGIAALRARTGRGFDLRAAVGPCIGPCCYEVDAPVIEALRARFSRRLEFALRPSRPGHAYLDLARLVLEELRVSGLAASDCGVIPDSCTRCDAERFHSYRRDGARGGRLIHHVAARADSN